MGENGHLAFNEPFTLPQSRTHVQTLTDETILVNSRFFDYDVNKVAVKQCVEGSVTHMWPISNLQSHEKGIMVCDELAASELKVSTYRYFKNIEKTSLL